MTKLDDFRNEPHLYGTQSLMNPYSLTRLMGSLDINKESDMMNYMYDIRDRRRFYDVGNMKSSENVHIPSNPTLTELINWSNSDHWGRTPYSFQDFVFSKWFGLIGNNRLITLRRYHAPTFDNLNFENMWGA